MFDWLTELFSPETFNTIQSGFRSAAPLVNLGTQIASGIEGTANQRNLRNDNRATLAELDAMFSPTGEYAKELRTQLERKDAAAGRRSQYGPREAQLMSSLAQERARLLSNPQYQNYMTGANRSPYSPLTGALSKLSNVSSAMRAPSNVETLMSMFGQGTSPVSSFGGASSMLSGAEGMGTVDTLGSMFGQSPFLPGYEGTSGGLFGNGGDVGSALTLGGELALGGAGAFGGAASALGGSLLGGGAALGTPSALGGLGMGGAFLPSFGAGGISGAGLFGGGAAAGGAAAGGAAAGSGAGAAAGAAAPLGPMSAVFAWPILGSLWSHDKERADVDDWRTRANMRDVGMDSSALVKAGESWNDYQKRMIEFSNYGTSQYDPASQPFMKQYYDRFNTEVLNNPDYQGGGFWNEPGFQGN